MVLTISKDDLRREGEWKTIRGEVGAGGVRSRLKVSRPKTQRLRMRLSDVGGDFTSSRGTHSALISGTHTYSLIGV